MKTKKDILQSIARTNKEIADAMENLATETDLINTGTEPEFPEKLVSVGGLHSVYDQPNGIPTLNGSGLINSNQLPSYVDDAIEGYYYNGAFYSDNSHQYEIVPESGKIYIDITDPDHAQSYRWTGSTYILIGCSSFNDLEPEAIFEITVDVTDPYNPVYTVTCDKTASDLSNDPLVRVIVSQLGYDVKIVAHKNVNVVVANIMTNVNCDTLVFTYNSGWTVVHKKSPVAISGSYDDLTDKPTIPAAQIQSDWNQTDNTQVDYIKNKPTIPASPVQSNWNESDTTSLAYIQNKPTIPAAQVQVDWNQNDNTSLDYIKNKPEIVNVNRVEELEKGNFPGDWRTPSSDELAYIINTRTASTVSGTANARYCKCEVTKTDNTTIKGLIIFPDTFTLPSSVSVLNNINSGAAAYTTNELTESQLNDLLELGVVFLPAAGRRVGTNVSNVNSLVDYWSSVVCNETTSTTARTLFFSNVATLINTGFLNYGNPVRLISEKSDGLFTVNSNNDKANIAASNLQYHCLNKTWRFAPNAYDVIGDANTNIAENYNGWIDLFGWGTSGWSGSQATAYQPWSTSTNNTYYKPDGTGTHNLTGDYANADWGIFGMKKTLHEVAFSGDYNDLVNKPIPTPTQSDSGKLLSVDASGNYELITIVNSENIAY